VANLEPEAWGRLKAALGLGGGRSEDDARRLVSRLFRCALALLHSPSFEEDHPEALIQDRARLPIPKGQEAFGRLLGLGEQFATLLDPLADADGAVEAALFSKQVSSLSQRSPVRPPQAGRGSSASRKSRSAQRPLAAAK
jgi:hypothetical protein